MSMALHIPAGTEVDFVPLAELQKPAVKFISSYWLAQRGDRKLPSRGEIRPREVASVLPHMALLKIEDGDFVYRVVGDAVVRAFAVPLQNRRVTEIARGSPVFGTALQAMFLGIAGNGEPLALRGTVGRDFPEANFTDFENVFLPLGEDHETVDHILTASTYTMRPNFR